jgi:putative membrane protein
MQPSLRARARGHVRELAAGLTLVSLLLVFGAALGAVPRTLLPRAPETVLAAIPHVNAAVSTVAIATILLGVRAIRRGNWRRHRALMLASLALFVVFLVLYLYKVSVQGPAPFPGPDTVYRFVYLPTLAVHIVLAIVCLPLLYYVALLALTRSVAELRETAHARFGRIAASLWLVSFVLGNVVYALSYLLY